MVVGIALQGSETVLTSGAGTGALCCMSLADAWRIRLLDLASRFTSELLEVPKSRERHNMAFGTLILGCGDECLSACQALAC